MSESMFLFPDPDAYWAPIQRLIDNGTLVPVEPDWEKAIDLIWLFQGDPMANAEDLLNDLRIALGIGGDE